MRVQEKLKSKKKTYAEVTEDTEYAEKRKKKILRVHGPTHYNSARNRKSGPTFWDRDDKTRKGKAGKKKGNRETESAWGQRAMKKYILLVAQAAEKAAASRRSPKAEEPRRRNCADMGRSMLRPYGNRRNPRAQSPRSSGQARVTVPQSKQE